MLKPEKQLPDCDSQKTDNFQKLQKELHDLYGLTISKDDTDYGFCLDKDAIIAGNEDLVKKLFNK